MENCCKNILLSYTVTIVLHLTLNIIPMKVLNLSSFT